MFGKSPFSLENDLQIQYILREFLINKCQLES